ncbi:MAG: hypothetical protein ACK5KO_01785 [Arachnia sp.]
MAPSLWWSTQVEVSNRGQAPEVDAASRRLWRLPWQHYVLTTHEGLTLEWISTFNLGALAVDALAEDQVHIHAPAGGVGRRIIAAFGS